jgi:hypothetical protein
VPIRTDELDRRLATDCSPAGMEPMDSALDLDDPIAVRLAVANALGDAGIAAATYGGLALAVYGEARETKDADLAVAGVAAADAVQAFRSSGWDAALTFERVKFGANRVSRIPDHDVDGRLRRALSL